ncbi:MAG: PilZ domain-containing protein [Methylicorpusculum sp.]|uniref:PilZ domain-containing protein n=1 Tax=Methylicorpusculum sp. TaxID=2713644 RepID=UPI002723DF7D|nr:PilZ domain-containing protein [Methylicorpusculum sp.]MDO8845458.1 PilZ domain-containing protein [Methylicorpusculum sp.]MDO8937966.1 PilZ domain-containing protein [Methylicorpusculum sp.]MDP2177259.1 PilZ domain-containing protein [Methylicorpusculum sp.]MDP2201388.1 PilZ domain-containing protein [Methylicorpusculum sp.]MDP3531184.1 PilZ domain-containing protein [Methylicorpusculum sp.]
MPSTPSKDVDDPIPYADDLVHSNRRKSVRYVRNDVQTTLLIRNFMGLKSSMDVKLFDISSRGVNIASAKRLKIGKPVCLIFRFEDGMEFKINAFIRNCCIKSEYQYGIQFEKQENNLADHLLKTQVDLVFK